MAFSFLMLPGVALAGVRINEVAWMGDDSSSANEWIELYNDGSDSVSVDGWSLSDGQNLTIPLSGTIAPGAYAVLERTDDHSAPGTAFLIYTGSLPNSGATLSLTDASGSLVDQVVGGTDWQNIGGDNTTKETAQRTSSGWVTGHPTPGAVNVQTDSHPATTDLTADATTPSSMIVRTTNASSVSTLDAHPPALAVSINTTSDGVVDQPLSFTAESSGPVKMVRQSVVYTWNFGDLTTATGTTVTHRYAYLGMYVVTLYGTYRGLYTASSRKTVTVLPVRLSLAYDRQHGLQLNNDAPYEIDLSGYQLITGNSFQFPARSIVAPYATITILPTQYHFTGAKLAVLRDANGVVVATTSRKLPQLPLQTTTAARSVQPRSAAVPPVTNREPFGFQPVQVHASDSRATTTVAARPTRLTASVGDTSTVPLFPSLLALGGVIGVALLGVFAGRVRE